MIDIMDITMWKYIASDVFAQLPGVIVAAAIGLVLGLILKRSRRKVEFWRLVLTGFLIFLVLVTLLEREPGSRTGVSLHLFETLGDARANAWVVENIILFIPYGFLLPRVWERAGNGIFCIVVGLLTSIGIESLQLATQMGHFQIDDMWTNTLGMALGWVIWKVSAVSSTPKLPH